MQTANVPNSMHDDLYGQLCVRVYCLTEHHWEEPGFVPFPSLSSTSGVYMLPGLDSLWWLAGLHRDSFN